MPLCALQYSIRLFQVFRKYSHSLGPEALQFLEEILDRHEIADEDIEFSIETIAREYNKQDGGASSIIRLSCVPECLVQMPP